MRACRIRHFSSVRRNLAFALPSIAIHSDIVGLYTQKITKPVVNNCTTAAPAGGAAAAARRGVRSHARRHIFPTSTRWVLLNLMPCFAWHGRGLNEVPADAIRGTSSCREAMYGGLPDSYRQLPDRKSQYLSTQALMSPARHARYIFFATSEYSSPAAVPFEEVGHV
jgi:hypothetical protein